MSMKRSLSTISRKVGARLHKQLHPQPVLGGILLMLSAKTSIPPNNQYHSSVSRQHGDEARNGRIPISKHTLLGNHSLEPSQTTDVASERLANNSKQPAEQQASLKKNSTGALSSLQSRYATLSEDASSIYRDKVGSVEQLRLQLSDRKQSAISRRKEWILNQWHESPIYPALSHASLIARRTAALCEGSNDTDKGVRLPDIQSMVQDAIGPNAAEQFKQFVQRAKSGNTSPTDSDPPANIDNSEEEKLPARWSVKLFDNFLNSLTTARLTQVLLDKLEMSDQVKAIREVQSEFEAMMNTINSNFGHIESVDPIPLAVFVHMQMQLRKKEGRLQVTQGTKSIEEVIGLLMYPPAEQPKEFIKCMAQYCRMADIAYERSSQKLHERIENELDFSRITSPGQLLPNMIEHDTRFRLLNETLQAEPGKPSHYLLVVERKSKLITDACWEPVEVVLCVRGTASIPDILTDMSLDAVAYDAHESEAPGYAHGGMLRSGNWLVEQYGETLANLERQGARVVVTGHSLGGGAATLCTMLLVDKKIVRHPTCFAFASPATVDKTTAARFSGNIVTVVHDWDAIPRMCGFTLLELLHRIDSFDAYQFLLDHIDDLKAEIAKQFMENLPDVPGLDKAELLRSLGDTFDRVVVETIVADRERYKASLAKEREQMVLKAAEHGEQVFAAGDKIIRRLHVPGTPLILSRCDQSSTDEDTSQEIEYQLNVTHAESFEAIEVSETFITDHLCDAYLDAFNRVRDSL